MATFFIPLPIFLKTFLTPLKILLKNPMISPQVNIPSTIVTNLSTYSVLPASPGSLAKAVAYKVVLRCSSFS